MLTIIEYNPVVSKGCVIYKITPVRSLGIIILVFFGFNGCSKSSEIDIGQEPPIQQEMPIVMDQLPSLIGEFMDAAHPTMGAVKVNSERTQIELTSFKSDDGPLLELYIATDLNATDYITLGKLQGLEGDFIYDLPNDVDFTSHKYLMVWCVDFSVNFGHAVLE